jgi:hypothetical protein
LPCGEIEPQLLNSFRVALSPQFEQQRSHLDEYDLCPLNFCVTLRAKRKHEIQLRNTRWAMMHDNRAFSPTRSAAATAAVAVALQNLLA